SPAFSDGQIYFRTAQHLVCIANKPGQPAPKAPEKKAPPAKPAPDKTAPKAKAPAPTKAPEKK
ncbi:hypothetical protein HQ576_00995, partial [bacterium]|nr:hypothetical protein [bacterium]